jgi:hypothetical protein
MARHCVFVLFGAFVIGVLGCGGDSGPPKVDVHPVTGKVTVDGKALTGCTIVFSTENPEVGAESGYSGELGADGSYTLTGNDGAAGAAPGKYKVTFTLPLEAAKAAMTAGDGEPGSEVAASPFPKEYASAETSPKEVEVTAGDNVIDLEL